MNKPLIGFCHHHNDLTEKANNGVLLHLPHNNNPGAALPAATIPVQSVPDHLLFLFYAIFLYTETSSADNQESVLLLQSVQALITVVKALACLLSMLLLIFHCRDEAGLNERSGQ